MRPVRKGDSPQSGDFDPYTDAKPMLLSRLGEYCSYCERRVVTNLAVEHIQPKHLAAYAHLIGRWENFLLGCVNCNSSKSKKDVKLDHILLPDRDNTFVAFCYSADGSVAVSAAAEAEGLTQQAEDTLALTGLDKRVSEVVDENGKRIAIDRVSQRLEAWGIADTAKGLIDAAPGNDRVREMSALLAQKTGFFSVWMTVFRDDEDMCGRIIDGFPGTRASLCFNSVNASPISPAPNPDGLGGGGKM